MAPADQLGRKSTGLFGLWSLLVTQMSIGAAQSPAAVALLFGLRGFSVHFAEDAAKGYLTEVLPARGRGMVLNLLHAYENCNNPETAAELAQQMTDLMAARPRLDLAAADFEES